MPAFAREVRRAHEEGASHASIASKAPHIESRDSVSIYLTIQLGLPKMRHERISEIEEPYVEPCPGWIKMLIWAGVILFGALFWEGMSGLIASMILGH